MSASIGFPLAISASRLVADDRDTLPADRLLDDPEATRWRRGAEDARGAARARRLRHRLLLAHQLKIEGSFVRKRATAPDHTAILRSTIDLGRNLGLEMFVEGVETEEVWRTLAARGRDGAQGYYLSPPLPAEELELWLGSGPESRRAGIAASGPASSLAR